VNIALREKQTKQGEPELRRQENAEKEGMPIEETFTNQIGMPWPQWIGKALLTAPLREPVKKKDYFSLDFCVCQGYIVF